MPSLSLVYLTYRPGGIDLLANSLAKQDCKDYELIVIDDHPGRVERGEAARYIKDRDIPLKVFRGSKPKSHPDTLCGLVNAMNTGLLHAEGAHTVFLHDFAMLYEDQVNNWIDSFKVTADTYGTDLLISGAAIVYEARKPDNEGDVTVWDRPLQVVPKWPWAPSVFECFYFGGPTALFLDLNGFDERADHNIGWVIDSIVAQAKLRNVKLGVDATNLVCHLIDHRVWDKLKHEEPFGRWKIKGEYRSLEHKPEWAVPSPNPFNIHALREETLK